MRIVGPSSEDEMVLAFRKAEIDSTEYSGSIERAISMQACARAIIAGGMASGLVPLEGRMNQGHLHEKDVVLVLDADEDGRKGTADIARGFIRARYQASRQQVLDKGKDLNEFFMCFLKP